jgi:hypothetical protein
MTSNSQENKGPSIAELQRFIKDKAPLEFTLINSQKLTGRLRWFDEECFSLIQSDESAITLRKTGVIAYRVVVKSEKAADKQSDKSHQKPSQNRR